MIFPWKNRPYVYDVIILLHPHFGDIGLCVNTVVSDVPAADHKHEQGNYGFVPQHGGTMMSMHKAYTNCAYKDYTHGIPDTVLPFYKEDYPLLWGMYLEQGLKGKFSSGREGALA